MKKLFLMLSVALLALTACSNDDNPAEEVTDDNVTGSWICQYAEDGISWFDDPYDYIVQYYRFHDDGTGFYELYYFKDNELIGMDYGRDWYEDFKYTAKGGQVKVTYELDEDSWSLTYLNGQLIDQQGHPFVPSTEEQDEQVLEWFTSQHIAGDEGDEITYIQRSWDGEKVVDKEVTTKAQWLNEVTINKNGNKEITGTWYVTGNHTIEGSLLLPENGELNIILCDRAILKLQAIKIWGFAKLRIYGQKEDSGQLYITDPGDNVSGIGPYEGGYASIQIHGGQVTAKGGKYCAGIGGSRSSDALRFDFPVGDISIFGGVIHATGGDGAAGIGGSAGDEFIGTVYIYGGYIDAKGGDRISAANEGGGAGIGGGAQSPIESVNIYGGIVYATGGDDAAGIGCGEDAEKLFWNKGLGDINIYGGEVHAWGDSRAAGIGGGDGVNLEKIYISGGEVKAHGGVNAAGIGGGEGAKGGKVEITGGTVYAYAGADGAGIGGGEDGDGGEITISGGLVFAYGNAYSNGFGAGIGGGQDGNSGRITISGGEVHAYGGDDAAGIGTGEETTSGPNIWADNITISGGEVVAWGGGKGAGIGAGEDAEVGTITVTTESGSLYINARSGYDCDWYHGAIGSYRSDYFGTLNIGNGVKVIGLPEQGDWFTIPVSYGQLGYAQWRCHVQLATCDHPGYTAETCIFCKH